MPPSAERDGSIPISSAGVSIQNIPAFIEGVLAEEPTRPSTRLFRLAAQGEDVAKNRGTTQRSLLQEIGGDEIGAYAERIRIAVAAEAILHERGRQPIWTTLSLGTAGAIHYPANPDMLIRQADAACYVAKRRGRNHVAGGADVDAAKEGPGAGSAV